MWHKSFTFQHHTSNSNVKLVHLLLDFKADVSRLRDVGSSDMRHHGVTTTVVKRLTLNLPLCGCQTQVWPLIRGCQKSFRGGELL